MPTAAFAGAALKVEESGEGAPLLFVHGFPLDHSMWRNQIDHFAQSWRVVAPDLRGFGGSTASTGAVTMEQFADDLAATLDRLKITEPVVLCGLSMGGYVAWPFFDKYRDHVRALILCDTRSNADSPETAKGREVTANRVLKEGTGFLAENMIPRLFSAVTLQNHPELVEQMRQVILGANAVGVAAAARGMAQRPEMSWLLPRIDVPTLIVVGADDQISPPGEMRTLADAIPRATYFEAPGAGHLAPLEAPAEVNSAIDRFLATLPD